MPSKRKIKQRKRAELRAADLARCEALIFAEKEAEAVVVTEELVVGAGLPKTETTSPEYLLRKMIVEKISDAEVVVASMKSSIEEKEQLIADNRATLAGSQEETLNLQKQLAILDNISGHTPTKVCERVTLGWTKFTGYTAYENQNEGKRELNLDADVDFFRISAILHHPNMKHGAAGFPSASRAKEIIKEARDYGGYVTMGGGTLGVECWIRVQTRNPNDLLKHMTPEKGSVVWISPGARIGLIKKSGYACVWSLEDA